MTVEEVLKQSGFTDEQIKQMDNRLITTFGGVLTKAEQDAQAALKERQDAERDRQEAAVAREAAELAQRSYEDLYDNKIAPSLNAWDEEKHRMENERARHAAEAAFYRTQAEEAKKAGFIAADAPGFVPPNPAANPAGQQRDQQGRYVPNAPGATPGSPTFDVNQIYQRAGDAVGIIADIQWEHQKLFGMPLPVSPTELVKAADLVKLDPKTYAARTYNWDQRRQQMQQEADQKRADEIAQRAVQPWEQKFKEAEELHKKELTELNRSWAERAGSNPDMRPAKVTQYADIQRGIKANEIPDPLSLNDQQRRLLTSQMIRKDVADNQAA